MRATHGFLTEADIDAILPEVAAHLPTVDVWVFEADGGRPAGFLGVRGNNVEMLFVEPTMRRQGMGTHLLDHVRNLTASLTLDVNEQNFEAHRFYLRYGFVNVGRSETDSAGRPFPIIHMRLK